MQENLTYIKNKKGETKSAFIISDNPNLSKLQQLSKEFGHIIYSIPKETEVKFNDNGLLIKAIGKEKDIWQFLKGWAMPYECFVNGFPFPVKMEEMWNSNIKVEEVDIEELKWNLTLPWWNTDENKYYNLKPEDVMLDINQYPNHKERIENAETKYPLLLIQTKQNRWLVYDGVHRFVKQILEGKEKVLCQKFSLNEIEEYIPEDYINLFKEWLSLEYK
jgi:hypothetical protein